jgi:hypothetical protein
MQFSTLKSARLASLLGFFTSLTLGCVVTVGDGGKPGGECPEINNHLEGDKCYCDDGYSWCDPFDDSDLTCCLDSGDTSNPTNNPSNDNTSNNDTTSDVPTGGTDTSNSDGTTTETPPTSGTTGPNPTDCVIETELPGSCDVDMGEAYLCLQASDPACDVEGSKYYICEGGVWVEDTSSGDESCKFDLDNDGAFSYGCRLDGNTIQFECGVGPGTACDSNSDSTCTTDRTSSTACSARRPPPTACSSARRSATTTWSPTTTATAASRTPRPCASAATRVTTAARSTRAPPPAPPTAPRPAASPRPADLP